jgi:hypothetical protein
MRSCEGIYSFSLFYSWEPSPFSAVMKNIGEYGAHAELLREKRRLFGKLTRRLLHLYRNLASHLLDELHELGVSTIYMGYPFNIAQLTIFNTFLGILSNKKPSNVII